MAKVKVDRPIKPEKHAWKKAYQAALKDGKNIGEAIAAGDAAKAAHG